MLIKKHSNFFEEIEYITLIFERFKSGQDLKTSALKII